MQKPFQHNMAAKSCDLLGDLGVGVLKGLPPNPLNQAFGHLPGCVDFRYGCGESQIARLAAQTRHVEVDRYALSLGC
ncbi:hypothetical protein [Propionivibrio sp.]|uniref:hypothetical protein n=1 Tax=Propionivibrio sp. TaxID=2212460 RepID=UPI002610D4E9|nr:hypothetical protein [Propionivibrio sp.]